jgi:hypothetical protein
MVILRIAIRIKITGITPYLSIKNCFFFVPKILTAFLALVKFFSILKDFFLM